VSQARWTVPIDHPAFAGHFPGRPIVPGVVLLDRLLSAVAVPCDIASAKFLSPAGPGEILEFTWQAQGSGTIKFDIACAGRRVATGSLVPK
jgi:3-hydroxymyristoyl/3-hydroxydecanoyl-(acyl carrier protein) dehydratase